MDLTEPPGTSAPTTATSRAEVRGTPMAQPRPLALGNETGMDAAWHSLHGLPVVQAAARPGHATGVTR